MKISKIFILIILFALCLPALGQKKTFTTEELERYKEKSRDLTNFYFYLLNTLASGKTGSNEKEIIVTESYKKYFINDDVQIEDDLARNREVPTNKDVDAYLKDVDFFFKEASFEYEIEKVTQEVTENGNPYIKVELTRRLNGITVQGDTLNNTLKRFIEFNISEKTDDLLIASIYTSKLTEKEDLINWWNELSYGWQEILKSAAQINADSITYEHLQTIVELKKISIRDNMLINSLEPLSKLTELENLDIAHTRLNDLAPLRNLTGISFLNATNTEVNNIEALRYSFNLKSLFLDETKVDSLNVLANLKNLEILSLKHLPIQDITPLKGLNNLRELYLSNTLIEDISQIVHSPTLEALNLSNTNLDSIPSLMGMKKLRSLDISHTRVQNLNFVSDLKNLEEIRFDNTRVDSLNELSNVNTLKRIYCDNTGITRIEAAIFMEKNPGTLVIFASDLLFEWWKNLDQNWKDALLKHKRFANSSAPSKEELASLTRIDSLNLAGINISNIGPLNNFHKLYYLNLSNNQIADIEQLRSFDEMKHLDLSKNPINNISVLSNLQQLEEVNVNNLDINNLSAFYGMESLKIIYAENSGIDDENARIYELEHPSTLIIYKTEDLTAWWTDLDEVWKKIFRKNINTTEQLDAVSLHKIIFLDEFRIISMPISSLKPLEILLSPKMLIMEQLTIPDLSPLSQFYQLEVLKASKMPVSDLSPLTTLENLRDLNLSDTPVQDLEPLMPLKNLYQLNLSSTQIKKIKPACFLENLRGLNIANTKVRKLKHLYNLQELEELICYNTRVSPREVEKFKEKQPEVKVVYYR